MARDKYMFEQLEAREIKGPGITLSSPCNAELLHDLQNYWKEKPAEKKHKSSKGFKDDTSVIITNKYGIKKRYPNMASVARSFGYSGPEIIHKLIIDGEKLRGGFTVMLEDEVDV